MNQVPEQLKETLLVAMLDVPDGFLDLPTGNIRELFPKWNLVPVDGDSVVRTHSTDRGAVYELSGVGEDMGLSVLYGPSSIGVRAEGTAYTSWPRFRDRALEFIDRAMLAFKGRRLEGLLLIYTDVFTGSSATELAEIFEAVRLDYSVFPVVTTHQTQQLEATLAGHDSTLLLTHEFDLTEDEARIVSQFSVITSPGLSTSDREAWLEDAHERQKWMLWHAFHPTFRAEHEDDYFDADEIARFTEDEETS